MDISEQIDSLVKETKKIVKRKTKVRLINIYAEGLKNKLKQAEFAIKKLEEFSNRSDSSHTATSEEEKIEGQVYFYSDAFWAFLYAGLDVLGQLVNQTLQLGLPEEKTDFKKVNGKLQSNEHKEKEVAELFQQCLKSFDFRRLDKYRNCALHRRHVYFLEMIQSDTESRGYAESVTGCVETIVRTLCDDPYDIKATVHEGREIPGFMIDLQKKIQDYILRILDVAKPEISRSKPNG